MSVKTAVVALGGNAILSKGEPGTIPNQFRRPRGSLASNVHSSTQVSSSLAPPPAKAGLP